MWLRQNIDCIVMVAIIIVFTFMYQSPGSQRAGKNLMFEYSCNGYDYSFCWESYHGYSLSLRQMKRVFRKYGLERRGSKYNGNYSSISDAFELYFLLLATMKLYF